jgi:hypothetical protein
LHIGTHILSESNKDNAQNPAQTRYQLTSHLQSNTLELDDKAQTLSSPALVIIDIVLCSVIFICFGKLVKGVVVVPM